MRKVDNGWYRYRYRFGDLPRDGDHPRDATRPKDGVHSWDSF